MTRKDAGFTLIELMTTLVVGAVILTLALPSFGDTLRRQHVGSSMHLISADMAMARNTAITRGILIAMCPDDGSRHCRDDGDWSGGWLVFVDTDGNHQPDARTDILRSEDSPGTDAVQIRTSAGRSQLRYRPDGRSAGSNLTVNLCAEGLLDGQVIVNNTGRVRSVRPLTRKACPFG